MGIISERIEGKIIEVVVQSSNFKHLKYDTESKVLTVTFNNGYIYDYIDVPWEIFTKLRLSESQGKYFSQNISKNYKFTKKDASV